MDEYQINALLNVLQQQRNAALNAAAQAEANNTVLQARIVQLEKDLAMAKEAVDHLGDQK